ncbi:HNH endonuclease [Burkholderia gladioli]|uniref:HNH endonuclease n=1 Tax=Burkholderia gladioli TaxID=28095 RepID=UPI001C5E7FAB|nr:HNH endonuclease [Burkholderia gladioli]MBW5285891.1 HNH endonuclease [Burkholderia gladioli]
MAKENWYHAAGIIWPHLVSAAVRRATYPYHEIASWVGTLDVKAGKALGPIQEYCLEARLPPLNILGVSKATGKPGDGFIAWDLNDLDVAYEAVYAFNWSALENPFDRFGVNDTLESLAEELLETPHNAQSIYGVAKTRGNAQRIFRTALLRAYGERCAICGLGFVQALDAAHIISWEHATAKERLDPANGILLCATHHKLFDAGELTVSRSMKVVYCDPEMEQPDYRTFDKLLVVDFHSKEIGLPANERLRPNPEYLRVSHDHWGWGDLR